MAKQEKPSLRQRRNSNHRGWCSGTVAALLSLFVSSPCLAASGWTDEAQLAEVTPTDKHYYQFTLPAKVNPSDCRDKKTFYQEYERQGSDLLFETLLKAITTGKRVRVYVTGRCNLEGASEISSASIVR